jgi:hypothetical protein
MVSSSWRSGKTKAFIQNMSSMLVVYQCTFGLLVNWNVVGSNPVLYLMYLNLAAAWDYLVR